MASVSTKLQREHKEVSIPLQNVLEIAEAPNRYKVHLASWNKKHQPLDVFVRSWNEWEGWNRYRKGRDDFNRPYVLGLIDFYPERNRWLFGGIFSVDARNNSQYEISLTDQSRAYIGRLKVSFVRPGRVKAVKFEKYLPEMSVAEILPERFTGRPFPGHEKINHSFAELEAIFGNERADWRGALSSVKGVYLLSDIATGGQYVGAAYGRGGIWARWRAYVDTAHGGNEGLQELIRSRGKEYARRNFRLTLLDTTSMLTDDAVVLAREQHWKQVLLPRKYGYNRN